RFGPDVFREGEWPYAARTLEPYYAAAERWLGATPEPLNERFERAARALGVRVRARIAAQAPDGGHWRGAHTKAARRARTGTIALHIEQRGDAAAVRVVDARGKEETLEARAVVVAASPIETTRLLLASEVAHPWIGRRLTDHFSLSYILVEPNRSCPDE